MAELPVGTQSHPFAMYHSDPEEDFGGYDSAVSELRASRTPGIDDGKPEICIVWPCDHWRWQNTLHCFTHRKL